MMSRGIIISDYEEIIQEFTINWEECREKFVLSKTLKVHIISDHLPE